MTSRKLVCRPFVVVGKPQEKGRKSVRLGRRGLSMAKQRCKYREPCVCIRGYTYVRLIGSSTVSFIHLIRQNRNSRVSREKQKCIVDRGYYPSTPREQSFVKCRKSNINRSLSTVTVHFQNFPHYRVGIVRMPVCVALKGQSTRYGPYAHKIKWLLNESRIAVVLGVIIKRTFQLTRQLITKVTRSKTMSTIFAYARVNLPRTIVHRLLSLSTISRTFLKRTTV